MPYNRWRRSFDDAPGNSPFKALQHRNFRLIWIGQLVSMAGSMPEAPPIVRICHDTGNATPDHIRGRMTSVNMIFFMGGPQLGELEAGLVASAWGRFRPSCPADSVA